MSTSLFAGLLFSCTGIEPTERDVLKKRLEALGGQYSGNLTRKVTHLIAGKIIRSEKYKSAKEVLKIPVLQPAFIEDCWTRSRLGSVDLRHLERLHVVMPLFGCHVTITGLSAGERKEVSELVASLGGHYSSELTKACTHLIISMEALAAPAGPKLMFSVKWGIPVVEKSWLYACQQSSMYIDERSNYAIHLTASQQAPKISSAAYEDVSMEDLQKSRDVPPYLDGCRIYLGDALDDNKLALLKRLILVAGGTRYSEHFDGDITHFIVHGQVLSSREVEQLRKYQNQPIVIHDQWLLACFVARTRLEPDVYQIDPSLIYKAMRGGCTNVPINSQTTTIGGTSQLKPSLWSTKRQSQTNERADPTLNSTPPSHWMVPHRRLPVGNTPVMDTPPDSINSKALFKSLSFYIDPRMNKRFNDRITSLSGSVSSSPSTADYFVMPIVFQATDLESSFPKNKIVNEIWLMQCMAEGRLLSPDDKPCFSPIICKRAIDSADFGTIKVCPTGFSVLERDYYASLVTTLGGSFSEAFSKHNTHLVCKVGGPLIGPKIDFAKKMNIPTVTENWLIDSAKEGYVLSIDGYMIGQPTLPAVTQEDSKLGSACGSLKRPSDPDVVPVCISKKLCLPNHCTPPLASKKHTPVIGSAVSEQMSIPAVPVTTPLRRDFNFRIKQATDNLLPKKELDQPSIGPTQAVAKETLATLMNGLVFCISQRLWHRREELYELFQSLGGAFLWTYDGGSCTHYLHQGNQVEETFREFRAAKYSGKKIVSPHWLFACNEEAARVPEDSYPHYYNPNGPSVVKSEEPAKIEPVRVNSSIEKIVDSIIAADEPIEVPESYTVIPSFSRKQIIKYAGVDISDDEPEVNGIESKGPSTRPSSTEGISQVTLGLSLEEFSPKVIMLSALTSSKKLKYTKAVKELGGELRDGGNWDESVTHLVLSHLTKAEKYLAAVASGIWVLRPDFIEQSMQAGKFVQEVDYEWQPSWTDQKDVGALKSAPRAWRTFLKANGMKGSFEGWKVLLAVDTKKFPGFSRILNAGKATVYGISDINSETGPSPDIITHVITSTHAMRCKIPSTWLEQVPENRIRSIEYVAEHLLSSPRL